MKAIRFFETGGPEVLQWGEVVVPPLAAGEVQVRHSAIGLNYIDTYQRSGLYPVPLPSGLGAEAAGVVEQVGAGVSHLRVGDRVAYGSGPLGAYSERRNVPANRAMKLPDGISDETGAAMMLKGMTVRYLLRKSFRVSEGDVILLHAAAGGVGLILGQWARALGAIVIGTVGSDAKKDLALEHGCSHVINSQTQDVAVEVRALTNGKGVSAAYDGVGQATLLASLDSLRPHGILVSFGNASGPVKALDLGMLAARGSLYVTRPTLGSFIATDSDFAETAGDLVDMVSSGKVKIPVRQRFALSDAATAHRALESRQTTGASVLVP